MVSSTHEQNSICSPKKLNDIAHEHTIICRQLFAGHVVGSRPMKRKKHLHRMIIEIICQEEFENNYNSKKIIYLSHDGQKSNRNVLHIELHKKYIILLYSFYNIVLISLIIL